MTDWWARYVGAVKRVSLYEDLGLEYNAEKLTNFVAKQAGQAIETFITMYGVDSLKYEIAHNRPAQRNPKYQQLLDEWAASFVEPGPDDKQIREVNPVWE